MESAEHLAITLGIQTRGIQILLWEHKTDLVRALMILKAALPDFPSAPILLPNDEKSLQLFSIELFEKSEQPAPTERRIILIQQASAGTVGAWLNGWRRQLASSPGTVLVIRRVDFLALYKRAPDLISFAQSEIHEATDLIPLISKSTLKGIPESLPGDWFEPLSTLPGEMPKKEAILDWIGRLNSNLD